MSLAIYQSLWGLPGDLKSILAAVKDSGFFGVEASLSQMETQKDFKALLDYYNLKYIPILQTVGPDHFASFQRQLDRAMQFDPPLVNSHTGRDSMSWREQCILFEQVLRESEKVPVAIGHETHRTRPMFTPWTTAQLCREFPDLGITADFSHWCCVCESLLEENAADIAAVIPHVVHIHARVGYAEGPQVSEPFAPEYCRELHVHESWWKRIMQHRPEVSVTPEYGPASSGYMNALPYTKQPVVDLWTICVKAAERMRVLAHEIERGNQIAKLSR